MKKENIIIFILIILLITMGFTIYYLNDKKNSRLNHQNPQPLNKIPNDSDTSQKNLPNSNTNSENSENTETTQETPTEEKTLPDFTTERCGHYFETYGICAGTCYLGECVNEGRSCYCKI